MRALKSYINEVSFLLGEDRRRVVFLLCLFLFSSFLDILGIGLIAPYVTLVINPESGIAIGFLEALIRVVPLSFSGNPIQVLGIIILVVFVLKAALGILINRSILRFCFRQGAKLRANLLSVYQRSPYQHFVKRNSAEYIYNINLAASFSQDILQSILRLLSVGIVGFVIVFYLALQDVVVLLLLLLMLGFVGFGFDRFFKKNLRQLGRSVNTESRNLVQAINEAIRGFKEVRILGREAYFHEKLEKSAWRYAENSIRLALIAAAPRYLLEVAVITFVILVVAIFSTGPVIDKELIPTLSMFGVAALRLFPFANQTVTSVTKLRAGRHTVSLLFADLARESQLTLGIEKTNQDQTDSDKEFRSLELRNVSFGYRLGGHKVLDNVSLIIRSGESIGIIGESGAGKTTLMDVILGLLQPQSGSLLVNGNEIAEDLRSWQRMVAYLPQDVFLIDGSVKENIALGVDPESQNQAKIEKALRQSQLDEMMVSMESGADTAVGEGGIRISGGQKQRLALARAFYHDRQVLVMDESTSALDSETEAEVMKEIKQLKGRTTTILIAHRLSTLSSCNRVYRLSRGALSEISYEAELKRSMARQNLDL